MSQPPDDPLQGFRAAPDPNDPRAPSLLHAARPGAALHGRPVLLGLPYDGGIPTRPGARLGPRAVREALAGYGTYDGERELPPLLDQGDLSLPSMDGAAAHARIQEAARRLFDTGARPVFVGGDHGCTGSIVRGLAEARPRLRLALISIDAHLDVRESESDARISSGTPFRRALDTPVLEGSRLAMIGIRAFANSRHHLEWVRERGVRVYGVEEVEERGAAAAARDALATAAADADALYLSVDLDAADAAVAPGVSAAGVGGLSSREMIALVRTIASDPRLVGADVMELSPPYDPDSRTARLAARLLLEILSGLG